ncbi:hypothetical protein GT037_005815 [Alternaria burnsii]|uniref:Uncharacterized protein n=1 Tax=Alternaria burnsii TaxID=1187904 RepID=A0A8H7EFE5_9PLEO|nr:uncharacterized protein GT037_005815 [Alternaria burnsii]KAF7676310.1 hypothetical protein GT037_005815 [Alternaria burnsii]
MAVEHSLAAGPTEGYHGKQEHCGWLLACLPVSMLCPQPWRFSSHVCIFTAQLIPTNSEFRI